MSLIKLEIVDFRNILSITVNPLLEGFNVIYGNNGSGKTSLLEAIYYMSRGRSFRTAISERIINKSAEKFSIFAQVQTSAASPAPIGIERQRNGDIKIRIAGEDSDSIAELAHLTPALLINSHSLNLLDSGPAVRRKYLDWALFYINSQFLVTWKQYERALKQRNAALKMKVNRMHLQSWTHELVQSAALLNQARHDLMNQLLPLLMDKVAELLELPQLKITYLSGWDDEQEYHVALERTIDKDIQFGFTQLGPHRADLKITLNAVPVKDILSRGQQKLFICAMILAQGTLLQHVVGRKPIYLVDDLPSELDSISRLKLIVLLSQPKTQVFLTAVEREAFADMLHEIPFRMFHVEHGNMKEA